ncbi:MAG: radical SAM protein [Chloroflexota bacterium]|nr:radical SAM protein [Chloroflexota bacterium]
MIGILPQIPQYRLFRATSYPIKLPINLTVSVTYKCNSRCRTCNVWKKHADNLSTEEYESIFKTFGKTPFWVTLSGGEPFLRKDLVEICRSLYHNCSPNIINIPTNGLLCDTIPDMVKDIVELCPKSTIVLNLSLDGIGTKHDEIRNVPGNWDRAMRTYQSLRDMKYTNLELGIHSVISKYNVEDIPNVCDYMMHELEPDSYITEIAEERVELDTIESGITPPFDEYCKTIDYLSSIIKKQRFSGLSKITQSFRLQYYSLVKQTLLKKQQIIPCYAGFASAQIAPNGDVWPCCVRAESMGNLRDYDYNFHKIWTSSESRLIRKSIKAGKCHCPLANASYTNMLCSPLTLTKVVKQVIVG